MSIKHINTSYVRRKTEETVNWKRVSLGLFSIALILSGLVIYQVWSQTTNPANPLYLSGGQYPGATTFTVFKEGTNYFAKDDHGRYLVSSTSPSVVVQYCIDNHPTEGFSDLSLLFAAPFTYSFDYTVNITCPVSFYGYGANLRSADGVTMFNVTQSLGTVVLNHCYLSSVGITGTLFQAINGLINSRFEYCFFHVESNFTGTLVDINQTGGGNTYENNFDQCQFQGGYYQLVYCGGELRLTHCKFGGYLGYAHYVKLQDSGEAMISNCGFERVELLMAYCPRSIISDSWFSQPTNTSYSLEIYETQNMTITGNIFSTGIGDLAMVLYGIHLYGEGIVMNCSDIVIANNVLSSYLANSFGIMQGAYCDHITYIGCDTRGITGIGMNVTNSLASTNTNVNLCWNGTVWIP